MASDNGLRNREISHHMNGYEFVERILGLTNYDVAPLIHLTKGHETEWLEFKAATEPPTDGSKKPNENKWDYRLDVSKALFAMANSVGGAVILGIGEEKEHPERVKPVDLEHSGFSGDIDAFLRNKLKARVLYPDKWETGTEGTWVCRQSHDLFRPLRGKYKGETVIIILVKPRAKEDGWLEFERLVGSSSTMVVCRSPGDTGQNVKKKPSELIDWWNNRETNRSDLNQRFQQFHEEWKKEARHPDSKVDDVIQKYLRRLCEDYRKSHLDSLFIPIYAKALDFQMNSPGTVDVLTLLKSQRQLVLLGDPGSGKSTCLFQMASALAEGWEIGSPSALLISLQEYTEEGLRSLILKHLADLYWIDIEHKINSGALILLFDALNECPSVYYENCYQELSGLLTDYPTLSIAITTRLTHNPIFLSGGNKLPTFDVLPLDFEQQQLFLNNYIDTDNSSEVLEQLRERSGTEFIVRSPVLLKMVASLCTENKSIPSGMAQLYHSYLQVWYERESKKEGIPFLWKFHEMRDALAMLSFHTRKEGKISCSVSFARDAVNRVLGDEARSASFINRVAQGLLLQWYDKDEFLHFSHETIQEYLTAVYLTANPSALTEELSTDGSGKKSNIWTMPMVFALELEKRPPKDLLESAWFFEPLIVVASLRDSDWLSRMPMNVHEDLWLSGVLRAMRGEVDIAESKKLSYISHTPPKYPLPTVLIASLRGASFWYAAQTHEEGKKRLERLRKLTTDRNSIWIELLPHVIDGHPEWQSFLSRPQLLLTGDALPKNINALLEDVTIVELCTLLRFRKITASDFKAHWKDALNRSNYLNIETDLLALLRTERILRKQHASIKFSELSDEHKTILKNIGKNWLISDRLLNILVRNGFLTINDIRDDTKRIEYLISRASPMNIYRFIINGILKKDDFSAARFTEVLSDIEIIDQQLIITLHEKRLIEDQDSRSSRANKRFLITDLADRTLRKEIETELKGRRWDVRVTKTSDDSSYGFARNSRFPNEIFVPFDRINNPNYKPIACGDMLRVFIEVKYNKKKGRWGYAVTAGNIV